MEKDIEKAIKILKNGGIIIFPTDTAFGIGCRIDNKTAIKRLFEIRKRPEKQAVAVLIDSLEMVQGYLLSISEEVKEKLIKRYWPGALTIILPCRTDKVPKLVRGEGTTLGVRIPNHEVTRAIIREVRVPILGPSANFHGEKTPYIFSDLNPELIKLVDFVVPGETSLVRQPSTVIDCSQKPWKILRQGAIKIQNYNPKLKNNNILFIDTTDNKEIKVGLSVGGKKYSTRKKVDFQRAQAALPLIDKLLRKHKLKTSDIDRIEVNAGPGSFTGLRVGISVANALSFALKIPVNKKKVGEFVQALYQ